MPFCRTHQTIVQVVQEIHVFVHNNTGLVNGWCVSINRMIKVTVFGWRLQPPALQCFSLTFLQLQPPATSQVTVFFSHTTPVPASSSSLPNTVSISWSSATCLLCLCLGNEPCNLT